MLSPETQRFMSGRIDPKPKKVITLDASHASLISKAKEVAGLIHEAACEVGK